VCQAADRVVRLCVVAAAVTAMVGSDASASQSDHVKVPLSIITANSLQQSTAVNQVTNTPQLAILYVCVCIVFHSGHSRAVSNHNLATTE